MPKSLTSSNSFSRKDRLKKPSEFFRVRKKGKRLYTGNFTVFILPNGLEANRLGVSVGRRTGNAVKRNRIKRLVREFFRLNTKNISPGRPVDLVISARERADVKDLNTLTRELLRVLKKTDEKPPRTNINESAGVQ
ncbi:MAG: ribonuclease P protein component [Thermodesulfobacteriota bacterium]|nr:MAG: ribonuclease P protein component [Thermodesulfobacteriota bacterium]